MEKISLSDLIALNRYTEEPLTTVELTNKDEEGKYIYDEITKIYTDEDNKYIKVAVDKYIFKVYENYKIEYLEEGKFRELEEPVISGSGTEEEPYIIMTAKELQDVNNNLTAHYKLGRDIDLSSISNWEPIGSYENQFVGVFDGQGYTVKNIYINTASTNQGLFGCISGTVKNVTLTGEMSIGGGGVAIVGQSIKGRIENCINYANVISRAINSNGASAAGIAGSNYGGVITNCINYGTITASSNCVGGIVGSNTGTVSGCINNGAVITDQKTGTDRSAVGGIVGYNWQSGIVEYCGNNAEVTSNYKLVGGIVGHSQPGSIIGSYNTGNVTGVNGAWYVGGIIGANYANCSIVDCYNTGNITGHTYI